MLLDIHDILMLGIFHSINIFGYYYVQKSTVCEDSALCFNKDKDKDMNKDKLYTVIGIIGLLSIVGFVIYLIGSFICFEVNTTYDNYNRPTSYIDICNNANMLEPNNDSSRPVKGMKYKDSLDSLAFSKHVDLSNIDGNNFYSREINEGLTSGKVYK